MQVPLEVSFQNMDRSPAVEAVVREKAAKLEQFADDIVSCRVSVEAPHKHGHHGKLYRVAIDIRVPDGEIVANRSPAAHHAHEDVLVAVRDAFDAARRQLQDHVRKRRGSIKQHEEPQHGTISELHLEYGRIASADGRSLYFHRNSVVDADFDHLVTGIEVRFDEEIGDQGPQASTVHIMGKQHLGG